MSTTETFLIALTIIYTVPYFIWRLGKTDYFAPLVVVQILTGVLLGPGVMGRWFPDYFAFVFNDAVIQSLTGLAWWAVMIFVWIAGTELNLQKVWTNRLESGITALFALGVPLLFGCLTAAGMSLFEGWIGPKAMTWQFILGIGMSCAVTALPILILLMEKMTILRKPIGQRILRYASIDDIAVWAVLALILMDWQRASKQLTFLLGFSLLGYGFRKIAVRLPEADRWYVGMIWLAACGFCADWSGLHFMVGAFLAGLILDGDWFDQQQMDALRHHVLLIIMPVFFLSTGLKTHWGVGGTAVFIAAAVLLIASIAGKLIGTWLAGKILHWPKGEAALIGWLLQTKALIMIIFANVLLDKQIITNATFAALLFMAIASTMLTVPMVTPRLKRLEATASES
ncbi:cation:proton antiporter [Methylomonas rapida]|uniref:Cation:proton antiporter n=1 Tax=Methylomonas rapida TaxID=2963939 RepID=A0ABY7GEA4_9GAMM|nr:cation:proton antiporter [Methylomonas rapida]WAR43129.1 cation:proton antiporter [Methylomonas rapida]